MVLVVAVFIIAGMNGSDDDNRQVKSDSKRETPKFGPGSFTGPIDDVTTRSPLGSRPAPELRPSGMAICCWPT